SPGLGERVRADTTEVVAGVALEQVAMRDLSGRLDHEVLPEAMTAELAEATVVERHPSLERFQLPARRCIRTLGEEVVELAHERTHGGGVGVVLGGGARRGIGEVGWLRGKDPEALHTGGLDEVQERA